MLFLHEEVAGNNTQMKSEALIVICPPRMKLMLMKTNLKVHLHLVFLILWVTDIQALS